MTPVCVLLTCDIHTHTYSPQEVDQDLESARALLKELGLRCTFFFPAESCQQLKRQVGALLAEGHEVGCHGLTHLPAENYREMPLALQRSLLDESTRTLARVLGKAPLSFRAPAFRISAATLQALEELGYRADLSVNSQKLGLFGSDTSDLSNLLAPRRPYHPSSQSPFRKGSSSLWEIPVSAWLIPFVSNSERAFGLPFMRAFSRCLYWEARCNGKPIVFMFHAEDLNGTRGTERRSRLSWRHFVPDKTYGLAFRYFFLERRWDRVRRDLVKLFQTIARFPKVRFLTVEEYLEVLEKAPAPWNNPIPC